MRIHTDHEASALADGLQARAFTVGSDIFFAAGAYSPDDTAGRRLLAHELKHTFQQASMGPEAPIQRQPVGDTAYAPTGQRPTPEGYPGAYEPSGPRDLDYAEAKKQNDGYAVRLWGEQLATAKHGLFSGWHDLWTRGDSNAFADEVAEYQWLRGLDIDGVLGPETWKRIATDPFVYLWETFTAQGTKTHADNLCATCAGAKLGVDTGFYNTGTWPSKAGSITNGIELRAFIAHHDVAYRYDVKRAIARYNWERTGQGPWNLTNSRIDLEDQRSGQHDQYPDPTGPPPYALPTPSGVGPSVDLHHVYSMDQPGFRPDPPLVTATSTEAVKKANFTERVDVIAPDGSTHGDPNTVDWHSTTWLTRTAAGWTVDARSEIARGPQPLSAANP